MELRVPAGLRPVFPSVGDGREVAADNDQYPLAPMQPHKRDDVVAIGTTDLDRFIMTVLEQSRAPGAQPQKLTGQRKLQLTIAPAAREIAPVGIRRQQGAARVKVDGPAIVRVDQRQIPKLGALVEIWHAGN